MFLKHGIIIVSVGVTWVAAAEQKVPHPFDRISPYGTHWTATFHADGTVEGVSECNPGQGTGVCRSQDTGKWEWQKDGGICITWTRWTGGCFPASSVK
jgi:hypothetical protein